MPTPKTPVVAGLEQFEITFGANQPQYMPLPALVSDPPQLGVISRWELTDEERQQIADGADIFVQQLTYGDPLHAYSVFIAGKEQPARGFQEMFSIGAVVPKENIASVLDKLQADS